MRRIIGFTSKAVLPPRRKPAQIKALFQINLAILAGFSSQEDLLSPTPSERFPVSRRVTFGHIQKQDPHTFSLSV
jgi:hypothetical protein